MYRDPSSPRAAGAGRVWLDEVTVVETSVWSRAARVAGREVHVCVHVKCVPLVREQQN